MDNTTQLFIRACKSSDPQKRVRSVYNKYYLKCNEPEEHIAFLLAQIVDKYLTIPVWEIMMDIHPNNSYYYNEGQPDNLWIIYMNVLILKIRLSEKSKFPEFVIPLRFKNKR